MKIYQFEGKRTCIEYYTIEVEAESFEEAQELVDNGDYEETDHETQCIDGEDSIEFIKEIE